MPEEIKQEEAVVEENQDDIPRFRTPAATYAWAAAGVAAIIAFAGVMLYAWSQVL